MKEEITNFNIVPPPNVMAERDEILAKAYNDLVFFGRAFLPRDFINKSASPSFHFDVSKKLISTKPGGRTCIVMPRAFGKSILSKAAIMYKLCFSGEDQQHFVAWVSEEQSQSIGHLTVLRYDASL